MVPENAIKVSPLDANNFIQHFHAGKFGAQRLGQAFCNEFKLPNSILEGKLFFEYDKKAAIDLIFENFVEID